MPVYFLDETISFPPPETAESSGLLAVGGDLSSRRLLLAYSMGIFPWYSDGQPILWFCPEPRLILYPGKFKPGRSLKKLVRKGVFDVKFDNDFEGVINYCAGIDRKYQAKTWITDDMIDAYINLHDLGYAHSVETYYEGKLVGGLYGVSLGGAFFGESMFHKMSNASKVALYYLVKKCLYWNFDFIDSQIPTEHMKRMGSEEISRSGFLELLSGSLEKESITGKWSTNIDSCCF